MKASRMFLTMCNECNEDEKEQREEKFLLHFFKLWCLLFGAYRLVWCWMTKEISQKHFIFA
jgi:hypothetical protein